MDSSFCVSIWASTSKRYTTPSVNRSPLSLPPMREPPKLADTTIVATLHAHYAIAVTTLTFLPIGSDSASAVYRVQADDGTAYLLKARTGEGFSIPSLTIPHYLYNQGVPHLVAPLPTVTQALWVSLDEFALSLYPFIDGRTGTEAGLSERHWRALGTTLKRIHTSQLTPDLERIVQRESYIPSRRNVIGDLENAVARRGFSSSAERELARFWRARREEIHTLVERADALGRQLRQASPPYVLCHADLHTWNVLLDTAGQTWIVDWDETVLAPKERDLMFVVGGIGRDLVNPHETACFFEGYGDTTIDPLALVYYRYAWAVQDMGAYGERVFFLPDLGEESRHDAVRGFIDLFGPGNIVEIALASDSAAP
jgi:spectinomycin phosphotransferase